MALGKLLTKGASKVLSKSDKAKLAKEAARQRALRENQKAKINKLESKSKKQQAESGMGTEDSGRVMMGELAKTRKGLTAEYKRTLKQVETNPNLTDEQLERMMVKLRDLRSKLKDAGVDVSSFNKGGQVKKRSKGTHDYRMNKGGLLLSSIDNRKKK